MEHYQELETIDIAAYRPQEFECERASNSYLMSVVTIMVGAPLPIINLLATVFFYFGNRRSTPYVKWHCTQALLSQFTIFLMNSVAFTWTLSIVFEYRSITDSYIAYIITVLCFNVFEFIITVHAAIMVRKGKHQEWWLWGPLTNMLNGKRIPVNN
jgi:uncharacterized Tic20 family protein